MRRRQHVAAGRPQDAASVASLLITAEAVVADIPDEKPDTTPPMPDMGGGMGGGMPGMGM